MNKQPKKSAWRYAAPVLAAAVMIAWMALSIALIYWAFTVTPEDVPPLPVIVALLAVPAAVVMGILVVLIERIKEIKGGEEDDAGQY